METQDSFNLSFDTNTYTDLTTIPRGVTKNQSYLSFRFDKSGIYAERRFESFDDENHLTTLYKHRNQTNIPLTLHGQPESVSPGKETRFIADNETTNICDIVRLNPESERFGRFRRVSNEPKPVLLDEEELSTDVTNANESKLRQHRASSQPHSTGTTIESRKPE